MKYLRFTVAFGLFTLLLWSGRELAQKLKRDHEARVLEKATDVAMLRTETCRQRKLAGFDCG